MATHCLEMIVSNDYPPQQTRDLFAAFRQARDEVLNVGKYEGRRTDLADVIPGGVELHYWGMFWFDFSEDLQTLKNDAETALSNNFTWWAWRYYESDHDEPSHLRQGDEFKAQNTSGTVPAAVIDAYT